MDREIKFSGWFVEERRRLSHDSINTIIQPHGGKREEEIGST